jgi:NAD(P)-dependent dehydrogenase (short-subunit alcohol dehydrogenase family)
MRHLALGLLTTMGLIFALPVLAEATAAAATSAGDPAKFDASQPTVLITGGNRGIGLEFVEQYIGRGWNIIATTRELESSPELLALADNYDRLVIEQLDVTDFARIDALDAKYSKQPLDVLLSNAGITPKYKSAFKTVDSIDWDMARMSLEVNAIGPLKLAQTFMDQVAASEQKKIVVISSKAGSFELSPKMPMMYEYRGSKAALNMYMYGLSFETPKKGVILTLLSPGQVNTVPNMKLPGAIETDESVGKMLKVIDGLTPAQNGKFLNFEDGSELGW